jgi:hypothetical protein
MESLLLLLDEILSMHHPLKEENIENTLVNGK